MIDSKTKLFCLLGHPVGHSKSPLMHNAVMKDANVNGVYLSFDIGEGELEEAVAGLRKLKFGGGNVTIPHKVEVMKYLDEITEEAKKIGAVNTLFFKNEKLIGDNTDGRGFVLSLVKDMGFDPRNKEILVLGAGGASRAICTKLADENAKKVYLYDIDRERALELKNQIDENKKGTEIICIDNNEIAASTKRADLIVNCTPIGMKDSDPMIIQEDLILEKHYVYDLIYNPEKTKLLEIAEKKGAHILNGKGMLVYQGALAFEKWLGIKPNTKLMFDVI